MENMNNKNLLQHRQSLISDGATATFEFPLMFTKAFVGEFVDPAGEKKTGKIIEGIASTETKDQQGETVMQDKMDCSYLLEKGYLNWNHSHSPEDQIGKPLEVIKLPGGADTPEGKPATFFRAVLFEGMPRAEAVWELSKAIENSQSMGTARALGFSVEGGVRMRQGNILVETVVRHMAVTHEPVNAMSTARIVMAKSQGFKVSDGVMLDTLNNNVPHFIFKSFGHFVQSIDAPRPPVVLTKGKRIKLLKNTVGGSTSNMGSLLLENLIRRKVKGSDPNTIVAGIFDMCKSGRKCHDGELFYKGRQGALEHLIECNGMTPTQAADSLASIIALLK